MKRELQTYEVESADLLSQMEECVNEVKTEHNCIDTRAEMMLKDVDRVLANSVSQITCSKNDTPDIPAYLTGIRTVIVSFCGSIYFLPINNYQAMI